jgi:hypothetical protein
MDVWGRRLSRYRTGQAEMPRPPPPHWPCTLLVTSTRTGPKRTLPRPSCGSIICFASNCVGCLNPNSNVVAISGSLLWLPSSHASTLAALSSTRWFARSTEGARFPSGIISRRRASVVGSRPSRYSYIKLAAAFFVSPLTNLTSLIAYREEIAATQLGLTVAQSHTDHPRG